MCGSLSLLAALLVMCSPSEATARFARFDFDSGPRWHIAAGLGPTHFPGTTTDNKTSFSKQLHAAGFAESFWAGTGRVSVDFLPIDFLAVGVEGTYHYSKAQTTGEVDGNIKRMENVTPSETMGFHRLTGFLYIQPNVRIDYLGDANIEMAFQLAFGVGRAFWTFRGETEPGRVYCLRPAMLFDWYFDVFSIGFRFAAPVTWIEALGPYSLSHSPTLAAEITLQTGVRF